MTQVQREAGFAEAIPKAIELEQKASAARQKYQEHRETLMANQFARERQFQYQAARDAEQHQMQRESWDRADDRDKERFARGVQEAERKEENQVFNQSVDGAIGNMAPGQWPGNEENEAEARTVRRELDRLRRASNDPNLPEESRQEARDQLTAALNGEEGLGQRIVTLNSAKAPPPPQQTGNQLGLNTVAAWNAHWEAEGREDLMYKTDGPNKVDPNTRITYTNRSGVLGMELQVAEETDAQKDQRVAAQDKQKKDNETKAKLTTAKSPELIQTDTTKIETDNIAAQKVWDTRNTEITTLPTAQQAAARAALGDRPKTLTRQEARDQAFQDDRDTRAQALANDQKDINDYHRATYNRNVDKFNPDDGTGIFGEGPDMATQLTYPDGEIPPEKKASNAKGVDGEVITDSAGNVVQRGEREWYYDPGSGLINIWYQGERNWKTPAQVLQIYKLMKAKLEKQNAAADAGGDANAEADAILPPAP